MAAAPPPKGDVAPGTSPPAPSFSLSAWLLATALAATVVATYADVFRRDVEFLNWDDEPNFITHIPAHFGDTWREVIATCFSIRIIGVFEPFSWLVKHLVLSHFGVHPQPVRVTSLCAFTIMSVLLFFSAVHLLRAAMPRTARKWHERAAFVVVLAWAVNPMRVEVVVWASCLPYCLCGMFSAAALRLYQVHLTARGTAVRVCALLASLACYGLALLSKSVGILLPMFMAAMDVAPYRRMFRGGRLCVWRVLRCVAWKIPYALLLAPALWMAVTANETQSATMDRLHEDTLATRFFVAATSTLLYVQKTLWPTLCTPTYILPAIDNLLDARMGEVVTASFVLVAVTVYALRAMARGVWWPIVTWGSFLGVLLPVSGIAAHGHAYRGYDRYSFLCTLPFYAVAGVGLCRVAALRCRSKRVGVWAFAGVLLAVWIGLSVQYSRAWRDSRELWTYTLEMGDDNGIAWNNVGDYYTTKQNYTESVKAYQRAWAVSPEISRGGGSLMADLIRLGRHDEALYAGVRIIDYTRPCKYHTSVYTNMAVVAYDRGNVPVAFQYLLEAVRLVGLPRVTPSLYDNLRSVVRHLNAQGATLEMPEHLIELANFFIREFAQ